MAAIIHALGVDPKLAAAQLVGFVVLSVLLMRVARRTKN